MVPRPVALLCALTLFLPFAPHSPGQFGSPSASNNAAANAAAQAAVRAYAEQMKDRILQEWDEHAALLAQETAKPPADPQATLAVHDGDPIQVKFTSGLSTKTAKMGDPVFLVLAQDLKVDGVVAVPAGSRVVGEVVWSEKVRSGIPAEIIVRMDYLNAGSRKIRLRGTADKKVGGLFPLGAAEIEAGLEVKAYIGEDTMLAPAASTGTASSASKTANS